MPERIPPSSAATATRWRTARHRTGRATAAVRGLRRTARTVLTAAAVLAAAAAGLTAAPASAAAPDGANSPATAPSYVENGYQDPVTALPPVSRPATPHCSVTVMQHDFANSYGQPYTGTVTPPSDCPGPWSKVVLTWSGSVAGRQYDRLAGVWIGGAEVLRTSTPEPDDDGITWHVDKDITSFTPLLRGPQPLVADLGNIVNSTYTGVYHMTLTLTYYQADRHHPAPVVADQVLPLSGDSPGWYSLSPGQSATKSVTFPRNLVHARLEVYARGGGCDEQWFDAVPGDLASQYPDYLCGGGPYRELQVSVDGQPAGLAQPYPVVYSGGIVPTLWRPIPAVDQFLTLPYDVDLTPFAGLLVDGRPHAITLTPYGAADSWTVDGTLFLDTDHHSARTSGALTRDTLSADPGVATTEQPVDGGADVHVTATRDWTTEGYLDTSAGRITTRVQQHVAYRNDDTVTQGGQRQVVAQRDSGATTVTTTGALRAGSGHSAVRVDQHAWSYPIDVDMSIPVYTDGNNYDLRGSVRQQRVLSDRTRSGAAAPWRSVGFTDDGVHATGVLARTAGTVTSSDGTASESFVGTTDEGACYARVLRATHGWITSDATRPCHIP